MRYIFTLLLFLHLLTASSQKLVFDVILFGNNIGKTTVEKLVKNDSIVTYLLNSASEAHILFTKHTSTLYYDIMYKRGQYISSYSKGSSNGKTDVTTINWLGTKYLMKRIDGAFNINSPVYCSTIQLFFHEPCDKARVFSERMGEYRTIKKVSDGVYKADMQDGLTYYYRYKNGRLIELEMRRGLLGAAYLRPAN
ncbi:MAG TPA: DUF6134 family protein [Chitinophagales bacterium]|nr:DUF6134 family protein [Chitinophagales bacterium]